MASIFDITLSDDENPQEIDSEDSDDGFKVCDNFTKEPPKKKFRKESGESSTAEPEILEETETNYYEVSSSGSSDDSDIEYTGSGRRETGTARRKNCPPRPKKGVLQVSKY